MKFFILITILGFFASCGSAEFFNPEVVKEKLNNTSGEEGEVSVSVNQDEPVAEVKEELSGDAVPEEPVSDAMPPSDEGEEDGNPEVGKEGPAPEEAPPGNNEEPSAEDPPPPPVEGVKLVKIEEGLAGGHFDLDIRGVANTEILHVHEFDDKYAVNGVVLVGPPNFPEEKKTENLQLNYGGTFKIRLDNASLSTGGYLKINDTYYNYNSLPNPDQL